MDQPEQHGQAKHSKLRAVIAIALIIPFVIFDVVLKKNDPSLGYAIGLFLGFATASLLSREPPRLWILLLIAVGIATAHFVLIPHY